MTLINISGISEDDLMKILDRLYLMSEWSSDDYDPWQALEDIKEKCLDSELPTIPSEAA